MSNPLFNALQGNSTQNVIMQFSQQLQQLKSQFKGDPKQAVEQLVQSGRVSQQQLIAAQQQAAQIQALMSRFK